MNSQEKPLGEHLQSRHKRDEIFVRMFGHLRREVPDVGDDPSLADPVLMLLLRALSVELEQAYAEIETSDERALRGLVRRLLMVPRGSRPAQTVVCYQLMDPGLEISPDDALVCHVPRVVEGQQRELALEFRPRFTARLGEYAIVATLWVDVAGAAQLEVTPPPSPQPLPPAAFNWRTARPSRPFMMFCIEARLEKPSDPGPVLFIDGPDPIVHAALWGHWHPFAPSAGSHLAAEGQHWTPATYLPTVVTAEAEDVFSFRSDRECVWGIYSGRFVRLPLAEAMSGPEPPLLREAPGKLPPARGARWWWQVNFAGDPGLDFSGIRCRVDCLPAENRIVHTEQRLVPDITCQGIELPVRFHELQKIETVLDVGVARAYQSAERAENAAAAYTYRLRPAQGTDQVTVWLNNPRRGREASRIEVVYATNMGDLANGVKAGSVERLLNPKPGVKGAVNLTETTGGRQARNDTQLEEEIRGIMRHHGRAVALQDYRDLSLALGWPFVKRVDVRPGVRVTPHGARRGVIVAATVAPDAFISDLQETAVRDDLERRLMLKSPVGTMVQVEFLKE